MVPGSLGLREHIGNKKITQSILNTMKESISSEKVYKEYLFFLGIWGVGMIIAVFFVDDSKTLFEFLLVLAVYIFFVSDFRKTVVLSYDRDNIYLSTILGITEVKYSDVISIEKTGGFFESGDFHFGYEIVYFDNDRNRKKLRFFKRRGVATWKEFVWIVKENCGFEIKDI